MSKAKVEAFADLEQVRLKILREKIKTGIDELRTNPRQQWAELRFERPLLETMLKSLKYEEANHDQTH